MRRSRRGKTGEEREHRRAAPTDRLALRDPEGVMLAALHVEDAWRPDREAEAEAARIGYGWGD